MIYGYIRCSLEIQRLDRQEEAISQYCKDNNITIDRMFADKISGKNFDREQYQQMKNCVQKDDVIIIKELDRFGRSMELIKEEWRYFMDKGVKIIVIDMPLISSDLSGKKSLDMQFISNLVFEVLCYSAEKERERISQRTKEGLKALKDKGVKLGRPNKFTDKKIEKIIEAYQNTDNSIKYICRKYKISANQLNLLMRERNIRRYNKKGNVSNNE